jgi:hypothetical protein
LRVCGLARLQSLIDDRPGARREDLALVVCQRFGWHRTDGRPATDSCWLLRRLERCGLLRLRPPLRSSARTAGASKLAWLGPLVNEPPAVLQGAPLHAALQVRMLRIEGAGVDGIAAAARHCAHKVPTTLRLIGL